MTLLGAGFLSVQVSAVTLDELQNDSNLTPEKFARYFSNFEFRFRAEVQPPEVFLATRSGDCDDYATLADMVLREKGYTPHLVAVRMDNMVHVVCYIEETGTLLDYNNRRHLQRAVPCEGTLEAIATKVARSFNSQWTSVSAFTYESGLKRLVRTVLDDHVRDGNPAIRFAELKLHAKN